MASNSNTTKPAAASQEDLIPEPPIGVADKIIGETYDLYFLMETISDEMMELDYVRPDGSRNIRLDRISALIEIARRQTRILHNVMARNYGNFDGKADRRAAA